MFVFVNVPAAKPVIAIRERFLWYCSARRSDSFFGSVKLCEKCTLVVHRRLRVLKFYQRPIRVDTKGEEPIEEYIIGVLVELCRRWCSLNGPVLVYIVSAF